MGGITIKTQLLQNSEGKETKSIPLLTLWMICPIPIKAKHKDSNPLREIKWEKNYSKLKRVLMKKNQFLILKTRRLDKSKKSSQV